MSAAKRAAALSLLLGLAGCGGDEGPASPGLNAPTPSVVRMTPRLAMVGYEFAWSPEPGATSYLFEIGSAVGATDVLVQEVSGTSFSTTLPAGPANPDYYLRLRSRGAGGESAPNASFVRAIDLRGVVEALFFEVGDLRPAFTAAADVVDVGADVRAGAFAPDRMYGWRAGARVTVVASTGLRDVQMQAVRDSVAQFNQALGGVIRASVVTTSDPDPRPRPGTLTIAAGSPQAAGCDGGAIGCAARSIEEGVIVDARLIVTPDSVPCVSAHEVGHGLYGFGHIEMRNIPGLETATMVPGGCQAGRLTQPEVDAIQASYQRGMRAGARRSDFVQAGLIAP